MLYEVKTVEAPKRSRFSALLRSVGAGLGVGSAVLSTALVASADTPTVTTATPSDWGTVTSTIATQVNVASVVGVIAASIGACIALVFMWWGVRKGVKMLMSAFKRGKLRV